MQAERVSRRGTTRNDEEKKRKSSRKSQATIERSADMLRDISNEEQLTRRGELGRLCVVVKVDKIGRLELASRDRGESSKKQDEQHEDPLLFSKKR
jgi:hypothetical protein